MKSEHRHELQTNELGKITEKLTAFMEVHGNRLMIGVCVASLLASATIYWVRTRRNNEAAAWRELASAVASNDPDQFFDVWNAYPGTPTGLWARVHEGESRLGVGVQEQFRNLDKGNSDVEKARVAFQSIVDDRRSPPEIRERALLGLARSLESLSKPAEAIPVYETLVKEFKNSIYKDDAEERIASLKKSGKEFYAWFARFERPKPVEKVPHDQIGDDLSDEEKELWDKLDKSGARKSSSEEEPLELTIPDLTKSEKEPDEAAPSKTDESDGAGDKGAQSKSKPDDTKPPADGSKPDES
jgi:hypothetical protein